MPGPTLGGGADFVCPHVRHEVQVGHALGSSTARIFAHSRREGWTSGLGLESCERDAPRTFASDSLLLEIR